jgi:ribonuclease E
VAVSAEFPSAEPRPEDNAEDGRRRRRGRGRQREEAQADATAVTSDGVDSADSEVVVDAAPVAVTEVTAVAASAAEVAEVAEAPAPATVVDAVPVVVAEVVPAALASTPVPAPAPAYVLQLDTLAEVARGAGLEWVNSDADKVRAVQEAIAAAPVPERQPRAPRPVVVVDEGPLILVETRRDLASVQLPFETPSAESAAA